MRSKGKKSIMREIISKPVFQAKPKDPQETFHKTGQPLDFKILDFWRWAGSNLISNAYRGNLAEFLVWRALNAEGDVRPTWDEIDLRMDGINIEVKSSAWIQDWGQKYLSKPSFTIAPSRAWDKEHGQRAKEAHRHSNVYVFCLLDHKDYKTIDPMNIDQWTFYVVPTVILNLHYLEQKTISLGKLNLLVAESKAKQVKFDDLKSAVQLAVKLTANKELASG